MEGEKTLRVPEGLRPEQVARVLAAMLWEDVGKSNFVPHQPNNGFWQLDRGNDFFLVIRGSEYLLCYRYEKDVPVVEAMVTIFDHRFNKPAA